MTDSKAKGKTIKGRDRSSKGAPREGEDGTVEGASEDSAIADDRGEKDDDASIPGSDAADDDGTADVGSSDDDATAKIDPGWADEEEGYEVPKAAPQSTSLMQTLMIFLFMMTILIIIDPEMRTGAGEAVGALLAPLIGFDGRYPVMTLIFASVLMVGFSSVMRHLMTDWYEQAR
ncbi:MAG: hypothetical protein L0Z54_01365, partial [Thermoplasmata archaeon]|nr:hypothetical protein [Thermoplasmata archaeon]